MIELGSRLARGQSGSVHGKPRVPDRQTRGSACMHACAPPCDRRIFFMYASIRPASQPAAQPASRPSSATPHRCGPPSSRSGTRRRTARPTRTRSAAPLSLTGGPCTHLPPRAGRSRAARTPRPTRTNPAPGSTPCTPETSRPRRIPRGTLPNFCPVLSSTARLAELDWISPEELQVPGRCRRRKNAQSRTAGAVKSPYNDAVL